MIEFTTSKGSFIAVPVPVGSSEFGLELYGNAKYLVHSKDSIGISLPLSDYEIIGLSSDILKDEELAKKVVETKPYGSDPGFCTIDYSRKENNGFRPGFCSSDGNQFRRSFKTLIESLNITGNQLIIKKK